MAPPPLLLTPRLRLRRWRAGDLDAFAALNADPATLRHFPRPLTRAESDGLARRLDAAFETHGHGGRIVKARANGILLGLVALVPVPAPLAFAPAVEAGWRFHARHHGRGYAAEAAGAMLDDAFARLPLPEVIAYAAVLNLPSRALMARLGMARDPAGDFGHPNLPEGHPLRPHVLHRLARADWVARRPALPRPAA